MLQRFLVSQGGVGGGSKNGGTEIDSEIKSFNHALTIYSSSVKPHPKSNFLQSKSSIHF